MQPQYPTRIPLGSLTPQPKVEKPPVPLPSIDEMQGMIKSGMSNIVEQLIKMNNLPLMIVDGILKDNLPEIEMHLKRFVTQDPKCEDLKEQVRKLAKVNDDVVITGESGTGKETIARALMGSRGGKFIAVNCAGLPRELIESELFGHARGAFTGADSQKQGMLAAAGEGVVFLDEIGELPLDVQGKLLRTLQDKKVRMVGSNKDDDIMCKFVCATHCNLREMVEQKLFRKDLFARISTFELHIPSLTERVEDVPLIIGSMKGGKEYLMALVTAGVHPAQIATPFNVRSLQQYVKRYAVLGVLCHS